MATYQEEDYDLISDTEIDILITDFPLDLIKENLSFQINNPLSTGVNYIENIVDRYRILKGTLSDNVDAMNLLNSTTIEFFNFLTSTINDKFELSINMEMIDNIEDAMATGLALYHFLILRYRKNVTRFIHTYIIKNKKSLVELFDTNEKRKDVTSVAIKKKTKNKDDILILSNLPDIVTYLLSMETSALDFIKYIAKDDNYEASLIRRMILEGNLLGEFVSSYLDIIISDYGNVLDEIQSDVKSKFIKKQ